MKDLMKAFKLFQIQGFETPEELFLVGYIMAHGGEQYLLELWSHDLKLMEHNAEFWLPHVKDTREIWVKVAKEEVETAEKLLLKLLEERKAAIPSWLKKKVEK